MSNSRHAFCEASTEDWAAFAHGIAETYLSLKDFAGEIGALHKVGTNIALLLQTIWESGPVTVSEVARVRGTSRQYAIKLARQLEAAGTVRLIRKRPSDRSYYLELTEAGVDQVLTRREQFATALAVRASGFDPATIHAACETLAQVRKKLARRPDPPNGR